MPTHGSSDALRDSLPASEARPNSLPGRQVQTYHPSSDGGELATFASEVRSGRDSFESRSAGTLITSSFTGSNRLLLRTAALSMLIDDDFAPSQTQPLLGHDAAGASLLAASRRAAPPGALAEAEAQTAAGAGALGSSLTETCLAIVKGIVGPAVLYLPKGFEEAGVGFGCVMIAASYAVFAFAATRLLECWRVEGGGSYGTLAKKALGKRGMHLVRVSLVLQQCGVLLTYFIFIATNVQQVLARRFGADLDLFPLVLAQLALQVPLGWIRDIQHLALTNLAADALILFGLVVILSFAGAKIARAGVGPDVEFVLNRESYFLFVGTSAFCFEGVMSLILPLQEAVAKPKQPRFPSLLLATAGGICAFYALFALANYLAYGEDVETVLTVSLPAHSPWTTAVQVPRALLERVSSPPRPSQRRRADTAGLPRRARAPGRVLRRRHAHVPAANLPRDHDPQPHGHAQKLGAAVQRDGRAHDTLIRADCGARAPRARADCAAFPSRASRARASSSAQLLAFVAITQAHRLDHVVALLGCFLGVPLIYIYPAAIHLKLVPKSRWKALDRVVVVCGFFVSAFCTFVTIKTWHG